MEMNKAKEVYGEINNLFAGTSKIDSRYKWFYLKKYHSEYLTDYSENPILISSYCSIASVLLNALHCTLFSEKYQETIFDDVFLNSIHHEAFMILVRTYLDSRPSYQQVKLVNLLEHFLKKSTRLLLLSQCSKSSARNAGILQMWTELITTISSLPERVANKTEGKMHKIFHPDVYFPLWISSVTKTLGAIHDKITKCEDCSLEFLGKLIGKFCILGHGDIVAKNLFGVIIKSSEKNFVWRKISKNLVTKLPSTCLETFLTQLLLFVPWYGYLDWIIGDEGINNSKMNYIMTTKLFFVKYFRQDLILQNIIGYFASAESRVSSFWTILNSLAKAWCDQNSLKHQSMEQQEYLAKALVVCAGRVKELKDPQQSTAHSVRILEGVSLRIANSEAFVRDLGMIVGHLLMPALNPQAPNFDVEGNVDSALLDEMKNLIAIPSKPDKDILFDICDVNCLEEMHIQGKAPPEKKDENSNESDSEDDLQPYDTSNDVCVRPKRRPHYLLDCLKGLIEQEDCDWFEMCLNQSEDLIEKNADTLHEIAEEMAKVLLHLEDKFAISNFLLLRHQILVNLTVHCPVIVANYLTSQFYADNYSIRQRLDILEVLAVSSQQLSRPKSRVSKSPMSRDQFLASTEKTWQVIVNERIAAKTRYFRKHPRMSVPEACENRFSAVAGHFFFPLLEKYDQQNKMLKLFGDDSYVLGRLIYTLGVIMHAATNIPMAAKMGESLLQFLTVVRIHSDVFVRQASIFALASVYVSVPGYLLLSDMMDAVMESQQWLQVIIDKDSDINCQTKASYALATLLNIMKEQEFPLLMENIS